MGYSIKVLNNDEFEQLPYSRVSTALGVADPKTNTAFVRYSAYPELNKYLIDHEFEHLVEDEATDVGEDGARYKDFGQTFGNLAKTAGPIVSLFNPGIGTAMTLGGGLFGGKGPTSSLSPGQPGYGQLSPDQLTQQNQKNSPFGSVSQVFDMFKSPVSQIGTSLLGLGMSKKNPKVPPLPQSVEQLRSTVQSGGSPLRQQATGQLSSLMNQQFNPLSEPEISAATRSLDLEQGKAEDQVRDLYRNLRPGTDPSSDSAFQRDLAEVQNRFATMKADQLANRTRDVKTQFDQQRMQQVQQALGADDSDMAKLAQIAQLDVNQIMTQLQMDYAEAQNFKQVFQSLGGQLLLSGMQASSPFSNFSVS